MPRSSTVLSLIGLLAVSLAGCTPDAEPDPDEPTTAVATTSDETPLGPEDVVSEVDVDASPGTITIAVLPLVRTGDGLVLTLDLEQDGSHRNVATALSQVTSSSGRALSGRWLGIRLVDTTGDQVAPVALDRSDSAVVSSPSLSDQVESGRVQLLFGDPGTDELAVLVPQGGLVTGIPVIDGAPPALPSEQDPLPLEDVAHASVYPMSAFTYDLLSTTRTTVDEERLTIALGSDVLFDVDSAELSDTAHALIEDAAAALVTREPGTVHVIGHTDSRRDEAHNQRLSEQRAEAVASVLEGLVDTDLYPLEVSGRGESEPVASNSSDEGRAANRRVELVLETTERQVEEERQEMPEATGPVATGAVGVRVEEARPYQVTAPRAWLLDGYLIVEVTVTALDDSEASAFGPALFDGRLEGLLTGEERFRTMAGVAVLDGPDATLPLAHAAGDDDGTRFPLTDLSTYSRLDGGDERTSALVYPAMAVGETVTIQLVDTADPEISWRLTDIPVEAAP